MKAVINEKETPKQPEYPMLMKATGSGRLVLFTYPTIGMVIHGEGTGIFHEKGLQMLSPPSPDQSPFQTTNHVLRLHKQQAGF